MGTIEHEPAGGAPLAANRLSERADRASRSSIRFRRFHLFPFERRLLREGEPVEIGSRAFDLLFILVQSPGSVVHKSEIVDFVWPSMIVEESNLRFQMASLRKILGPDRDIIKTIQGRGYLFVGETLTLEAPEEQAPSDDRFDASTNEDRPPAAVAVIDDDDCTREALDGLLRSSGFAVQCYRSVEAFVQRPVGPEPGCLVLDVCMPGRTGLDLQSDLTRAGMRLPVIFISGHADVHMSVRAMKAGAMEFLTKPVRHEELLDAVQSAVSRH